MEREYYYIDLVCLIAPDQSLFIPKKKKIYNNFKKKILCFEKKSHFLKLGKKKKFSRTQTFFFFLLFPSILYLPPAEKFHTPVENYHTNLQQLVVRVKGSLV